MNAGTKRQATRLAAVALASGVTVAMAAGSAGATPTANIKHKLQGTAQTDVVQVSVNVPLGSTLAGLLPTIANINLAKPITIGLIHTEGKLVRDQIANVVDSATSTSTLGSGTLFDKGGLLAAINRSVTATLAHGYQKADGIAFNQAPLQLAVPTLTATAKRGASNTLHTSGIGELAGLQFANLAQLLDNTGLLSTLNQQLAALIGDPNGSGGGVTGTVVNTVNTLLGQIDQTLQSTPVGSVTHVALTTLQNELKALQAALPQLVATLESGSVIDLKALDSNHDISTTAGNAVSATARGVLAHLSLLGGFVTLDGFNNSVTATANGKANGAKAIVNPNLAQVHIGSPVGLNLIIGPNGTLTGSLLNQNLPTSITNLVNQLISSISNVLSLAGVKIAAAKYDTKYNSDHSAVSVAGSGLQVLVNDPLHRSNTDFSKALVGVKVGALAASAGDFVQASTPKRPTPVTPHFTHPHTGANLPVTAGAALVFLTGAYLVRRRFANNTEV